MWLNPNEILWPLFGAADPRSVGLGIYKGLNNKEEQRRSLCRRIPNNAEFDCNNLILKVVGAGGLRRETYTD